jgi:ankyrin repeat protein
MPFNSTELIRVCHSGDLAAVKELVQSGADVNSVGDHGMGPLLCFTPSIVEYLLSKGADPNRQTNEGGHAVLLGIAYFNQLECVRLLLDAGADPKVIVPETGENALHGCVIGLGESATPADRHELVKLLIERGADPNQRTIPGIPTGAFWRDVRTRGETPLHRAAAYAPEETVEFLLKSGADKTIRDANGDSPQTWASWHWRSKRLIDLLDPRSGT